jgi:dephospho-CoA kinase
VSVYRVGLTGGIASGKSTVAEWLREAGFQVVDADRLVAELYRPGAAGVEVARRLFGDAVVTAASGVDHAALAARVFADPAARRALEEAIHPLVRRRFEEIAAAAAAGPQAAGPSGPAADPMAGNVTKARALTESAELPEARGAPSASPGVVVLEATLLVEAGYGPGFDLIVTVEADPEARVRRAVARGLAEDAARARLAAQGDGASRRAGAHRVLHNDGSPEELRRQVEALVTEIRAAAASAVNR